MISAGIVAMAHFTIKTTIDENDILMSVTTISLISLDPMMSSIENNPGPILDPAI